MNTIERVSNKEIREWLIDRLHMRGYAASDINTLAGESPFDKPARLFKEAGNHDKARMERVVCDFLEDPEFNWTADAFNELSHLIETCEMWTCVRPLKKLYYRLTEKADQIHEIQAIIVRTMTEAANPLPQKPKGNQ